HHQGHETEGSRYKQPAKGGAEPMISRLTQRILATGVAGLLACAICVPAASASEAGDVAIAEWFTTTAPSQVISALSSDSEWLAELHEGSDGALALTFGDPVPE